jgi:hypothetical protein
MTRYHNHLTVRSNPFEPLQYLNAIHPWHPDIEKSDIRPFLLEDPNRFFSAPRLDDPETFVLQNPCNRLNHPFLIIHDEDFFFHKLSQ